MLDRLCKKLMQQGNAVIFNKHGNDNLTKLGNIVVIKAKSETFV
jgi:hypothetical protein